MNKAERVYQLVKRERSRSDVTVSDIMELCEFFPSESPKAIAMRVIDFLKANADYLQRSCDAVAQLDESSGA